MSAVDTVSVSPTRAVPATAGAPLAGAFSGLAFATGASEKSAIWLPALSHSPMAPTGRV